MTPLLFLATVLSLDPGMTREAMTSGWNDGVTNRRLARELARFPSETECWRQIYHGEQHLIWAHEQAILYSERRDVWETYAQQVEEWTMVWRALLRVRQPNIYGPNHRLESLETVREAIGEQNWQAGFVYSPVASYFLCRPETYEPRGNR